MKPADGKQIPCNFIAPQAQAEALASGHRAKRGNRWPSEGMRSRRPNVSLLTEKDIKNVFPASRPIARFPAGKRSEPAKRAPLS